MSAASELIEKHDAIATISTKGIECTYLPKAGPAREVLAVVNEDGIFIDPQAGGIAEHGTLAAFVLRDAEHETLGGIDTPQIGDGLRLGRDPEDKIYAFTGERTRVERHSWTLIFSRTLPYERGGNRIR
jgi:hypothetical protein